MVSQASTKPAWMSFQTQLLSCEIGAIVLSGFTVNCLSDIPRHGPGPITPLDFVTWCVAAFLPAAWSGLGAVACISYGSFLRDRRAGVQQWTEILTIWQMLGKALPEVAAGDKRVISEELTNTDSIHDLKANDEAITTDAEYEVGRIERRNRGDDLILPALALGIALAIRITWSYGVI